MKTKINRSIFALLLTLALVFQMASPIMAFAAVSDRDTSTKYTESLGDNASTEYAGRVWTDKSVFSGDVTFDTYGGGTVTVKLNENSSDEEFLVAYSALATSESISGQSQAPVDVVLILDVSGSMSNGDSNMDNGKSRIYNAVQAANAAIEELMALNGNTRVAVVAFSSTAQVLLPLDRYEKVIRTERQWVQTGPFSGDWVNVEVIDPFLSVSRDTGSNNYADLTVSAINSSDTPISKTIDVEGGTNIQVGLYESMKLLAEETSTKATVNGAEIQRVPSIILLSDGAPTYSSNSRAWWAPEANNNDGPGSAPYAGNGMKAILVGSYMKNAIDRNYGVAGTAYGTTIYTVGMGITGLSESEKNLAYMTLDPGTYWNDTSVINSMKTTIKDYWSAYTANNNTGTLNINVGQSDGWDYYNKNYALTHPTTGYDVDPVNGYDYVDDYYDADNADAVVDVFQQIVSSISISAPQVPTEIKGDDPLTDGYITYTDPIGQYMEVKDVKSIIYAGTEFTQKTATTANGVTTYVFSGAVHSPVYGDQEIKNIVITVSADSAGNETLTVKIPASVIPLRVNEVTLNADGSVKTHTNNGAFPARVIYSVGLKDGIKQVSDDGHAYIDATKVSAEYIAANTNADGEINFYSNIYDGTNKLEDDTPIGNAIVEFEPSHTNPFYYILSDMPIYKDREFTTQVTAQEGLADDGIYYYKEEFYHGTNVEVLAIARTGAQLKKTEITTGTDGNLYRAAGSPRLNRIMEFEGTKIENATGTAQDFYAPTFQHAAGSTDPFEGKFVIYLGNNGVMSLPAGGDLEIRKDVATAAGITAPGKTFTFNVDLDGEKINGGEYTYIIRDAQQNQVSTGTVSKANPTISLADGQVATIYSLPPMTTYTITEAAVAGFTATFTGDTGTIHAGETQYAAFTNTYAVTPVTSENLEGTKVLTGRKWAAGDSFTFFLSPYNDCPLPAGYDADAGVTVTAPDAADGNTASFEFGTITFTAPGTYRYTVVEKEPESGYLPGMTYSRAVYRILFKVDDNGSGALVINENASGIQKLFDDNANQLFTYNNDQIVMNPGQEAEDAISFINSYKAEEVVRVPVALKEYADPSGTKPLLSGMFQFQLKAIGYYLDGDANALQTDITKVPMPEGHQNGVIITTNTGHDVAFPSVTFKQGLIPTGAQKITYRYEMSEVVPEETAKVPGMTYDETHYTIDVEVQIAPNSSVLQVSAVYQDGLRIPTFRNSFALESVTADINGTKVLNGRDMLAGETFSFTLTGANAATNSAISSGYVVVPNSSATVNGGKDGVASGFSFQDIQFNRPGTYTFLVAEADDGAPAVSYDDSKISVTFEIADTNGDAKLEVVSTTYSDGGNTADFVNTYTSQFTGTPVSLTGIKNLTGKSLLQGEFFFHVEAYHNDSFIGEGLTSHTEDKTGINGTYSGQFTILNQVTYDAPGTYTYYISEQIPAEDLQVGSTTYDDTKYRYVVVVEDNNKGGLVVTSQTLTVLKDTNWVSAQSVVFNNEYVSGPTFAHLPLIKKVIEGGRDLELQTAEFRFQMAVTAASPSDGIVLPDTTEVYNTANGDVAFGQIKFTKAGIYTVTVTEILPDENKRVPGITYSTQQIHATFEVVDNRNGTLTATLTQFDGGDTFINEYVKQPTDAVISGKKVLQGGTLNAGDFSFHLYETDSSYSIENKQPLKTLSNAEDGSFTFDKNNVPALNYTDDGVHYYVLVEDTSDPIDGIRYDTTAYHFEVKVKDNSDGTMTATVDCINGDENNIIFRNITHDQIVTKEVSLERVSSANIDGQKVNPGETLCYTITYHNYTGALADVTITDTIPTNTTFVEADNGGVFAGGTVTWTLNDVPVDEEVSVTVKVKVNKTTEPVENEAVITEGNNSFTTNTVTNPVTEDEVEKDVALATAATVSIDGKQVKVGDVLQYTITYYNNDSAAATVTVTDTIPEHTTFVEAGNGGSYAAGKVTWTVNVAANSSETVTFQVKVNDPDVFIDNQAIALQGENQIETNVVTNHTFEEVGGKDVFLKGKPTISIDGKQVQVGQVLEYTIDYTNITDADVDVTITDTIPAHTKLHGTVTGGTVNGNEITWTFTDVAPRETVSVTFQVEVTEPGTVIENQAKIFDGTNKLTNKVTNAVPNKTVDQSAASIGDTLTYTLTYTNVTGAPAKVVITDKLDQALTFVEADNGGKEANGTVTWTLENVPSGETVTVTLRAKITAAAGEIRNTAQFIENNSDAVFTNGTITKVEEAKVTISKAQAVGSGTATTNKLTVNGGDIVTYTLTVTNNGEGDAYGITVTDVVPKGLSFVSAQNGGKEANGTVTWELAELAAGESAAVTFKVKIPSVEETTTWTNIASMTYDNNPDGGDKVIETNKVVIEEKVTVTPDTGDRFSPMAFFTMMVLSSFGLVAVVTCKKREEAQEAE